MGITGKAFQKLHDISTVSKSQPTKFGAVPQRNFGGLIRKAAELAQVTSTGRRTSVSELGTIAKAKDAKGHGSEKRGGGGDVSDYKAPRFGEDAKPITTFPNEKYVLGHGGHHLVEVDNANTGRKMMVAVRSNGVHTDYPLRNPSGTVTYDHPEWFPKAFRDKVQTYSDSMAAKDVSDAKMEQRSAITDKLVDRAMANGPAPRNAAGCVKDNHWSEGYDPTSNSVGKSLSIFGLMQGLAKAKDAKGHGSEKRGGGGSGAGGDQAGSHVVQDAENGPLHFVKDPQDGYVSAVWPNTVADNSGNIQSFDPQGGHGAASKEWFKTQVPASREEAQKVHNQLTSAYGYKLSPLPKSEPREKVVVRGVESSVPRSQAGAARAFESTKQKDDWNRNDMD